MNGKTLKQLRLDKGWSQSELAAKSGVSLRTISYTENHRGNRPIQKATAKALYKALGVPYSSGKGLFGKHHRVVVVQYTTRQALMDYTLLEVGSMVQQAAEANTRLSYVTLEPTDG